MAYMFVEDDSFPAIFVTFPNSPTAETITQLFAELEGAMDKHKQACGVLVDLTLLNPIKATAKERKAVSDEGHRLRDKFVKYVKAEVRIVPSRALRGVMIATEWMEPSVSWKRATVGTWDEGCAWLKGEFPIADISNVLARHKDKRQRS